MGAVQEHYSNILCCTATICFSGICIGELENVLVGYAQDEKETALESEVHSCYPLSKCFLSVLLSVSIFKHVIRELHKK